MATVNEWKPPARWRAVVLAAAASAVLGVLAVYGFSQAEKRWFSSQAHPTVFPYLAAAVVYFAACVWVVLDGHATLDAAVGKTSVWRWPQSAIAGVIVFAVLFVLLSLGGMAGPEAIEAVRRMNCYLVESSLEDCKRGQVFQLFNYIAAAGNAMAIAVVVFLGMKCYELVVAARGANDGQVSLRRCARGLSELLVLASTVLVTATLALYLLFVASSELANIIPRTQQPAETIANRPKGTDATRIEPKASIQRATTLRCGASVTSGPFECTLIADIEASPPKAIAPAMAFVAGLSFTGALFFLFMTASAAFEDVVQNSMERARANFGSPEQFNAKSWLEQEGLAEGTKDLVLRTLAMAAPAAPAATGAITVLSG